MMTSNIEILKGVAGFVTRPSDKTSMLVRILLNGVCDVNGVPLLKDLLKDCWEKMPHAIL